MRFMILLKADRNTEAGVPPSTELIAAMMKYSAVPTKLPLHGQKGIKKQRLKPPPLKFTGHSWGRAQP
jgi:hypothetical protein